VQSGFTAFLGSCVATAIAHGDLPASEDPALLAFELHSVLLGADTNFILHDDPAALDFGRRIVRHRLGLDSEPIADRN